MKFQKFTSLALITALSTFVSCSSGSNGSSDKKKKTNNESFLAEDLPELHKMLSYVDPEYGVMNAEDEEQVKLFVLWGEMIEDGTSDPESQTELREGITLPTINSEVTRAAFYYQLRHIYTGLRFQPESEDWFASLTDELFVERETTSVIAQIGRIAGIASIFDAMARQPENMSNMRLVANENKDSTDLFEEDIIQVARCYSIAFVLTAAAVQPEATNSIKTQALELLGEPIAIKNAKAKAACEEFMNDKLEEAIAEQPEMESTLTDLSEELI